MKIHLGIILLSTLLFTGCIQTPVMGELSDGTEPLLGQATGSLVSGTFEISNLDGLSCKGSYNPYSQSPSLQTEIKCSDGRFGKVSVLRSGANLTNGSGVGKLNDGTKIRILIGDVIHQSKASSSW